MLPTLSFKFMSFSSQFVREASHGHHNAPFQAGVIVRGLCVRSVRVQVSCRRALMRGRALLSSKAMTRVNVSRRHGHVCVFNRVLQESSFSTEKARLRLSSSEERPRQLHMEGEGPYPHPFHRSLARLSSGREASQASPRKNTSCSCRRRLIFVLNQVQ
jgi:hypothetical protein